MGKSVRFISILGAFAGLLTFPYTISAHEQSLLEIGGKDYVIAAGFVDETPIAGEVAEFDLLVLAPKQKVALPVSGASSDNRLVSGLHATLQAEITASNQRRIFTFLPVSFQRRGYRATFTPTEDGPYSFRIFGTIAGQPIELITTCTAGIDHTDILMRNPATEAREVLAHNVIRKSKSGGFLCPRTKETIEIPRVTKESTDLKKLENDLKESLAQLENDAAGLQMSTQKIYGFLVGFAILGASVITYFLLKRRGGREYL